MVTIFVHCIDVMISNCKLGLAYNLGHAERVTHLVLTNVHFESRSIEISLYSLNCEIESS